MVSLLSIMGGTEEDRLEQKKLKESERVIQIMECVENSEDVYEAAVHLIKYFNIVDKSQFTDMYDSSSAQEVLLKKVFSEVNRNGNLKKGIESFLEGDDEHQSVQELLQDIRLTEEDVTNFCFEEKLNSLNEILDGLYNNLVKMYSDSGEVVDIRHFGPVDNLFSTIERLYEAFGKERSYNDIGCKKLFNIGNSILQKVVKSENANSSKTFFLSYQLIKDITGRFRNRLLLTDNETQNLDGQQRLLDTHALDVGIESFVNYVNNSPVEEMASDQEINFYDTLKKALNDVVEEIQESGLKTNLKNAINNADAQRRKNLKEYEPVLCKHQDVLYDQTMTLAKSVDMIQESKARFNEATVGFVRFSKKYSKILEEDDKDLNRAVEKLQNVSNIAYHTAATALSRA